VLYRRTACRTDIYKNFLLYCMTGDVVQGPMGVTMVTGGCWAGWFRGCWFIVWWVLSGVLGWWALADLAGDGCSVGADPLDGCWLVGAGGKLQARISMALCNAHRIPRPHPSAFELHSFLALTSLPCAPAPPSCPSPPERDDGEFARLSQLGDILGLSQMDVGQVNEGHGQRGRVEG
jgi:hypothetical protein